jgi:serine/threonine protein kinase
MQLGSLHSMMHNETMTFESAILLDYMRDIVSGMRFLHSGKHPVIHSDLKSQNVLVDDKHRAKVCCPCTTLHVNASPHDSVVRWQILGSLPVRTRRSGVELLFTWHQVHITVDEYYKKLSRRFRHRDVYRGGVHHCWRCLQLCDSFVRMPDA